MNTQRPMEWLQSMSTSPPGSMQRLRLALSTAPFLLTWTELSIVSFATQPMLTVSEKIHGSMAMVLLTPGGFPTPFATSNRSSCVRRDLFLSVQPGSLCLALIVTHSLATRGFPKWFNLLGTHTSTFGKEFFLRLKRTVHLLLWTSNYLAADSRPDNRGKHRMCLRASVQPS